jgi:Microcystin-dependent protein
MSLPSKIPTTDYQGHDVESLADQPLLASGDLKKVFDYVTESIVIPKINAIIDAMVPDIGDLYFTTNATNPGTSKFPGTTWIAWGGGRVPVGVGNNGTNNYTNAEATGGEEKHQLIQNEAPSHNHATQLPSVQYGGVAVQNGWYLNGGPAANPPVFWSNSGIGYVNGPAIGSTGSGGDAAHNNMQPYITCYIWKRTA